MKNTLMLLVVFFYGWSLMAMEKKDDNSVQNYQDLIDDGQTKPNDGQTKPKAVTRIQSQTGLEKEISEIPPAMTEAFQNLRRKSVDRIITRKLSSLSFSIIPVDKTAVVRVRSRSADEIKSEPTKSNDDAFDE